MLDTPTQPEEKVILEGQAAIDLWLLGKDAWNAWVKENPIADIDFSHIDFSLLELPTDVINFASFRFPEGYVSFTFTNFGKGKVLFLGTEFGNGGVYFGAAIFGRKGVFFDGAKFGDGDIMFNDSIFGDGPISFHIQQIGKGNISFNKSTLSGDFSLKIRELAKPITLSYSNSTFNGRVIFDLPRNAQNLLHLNFKNSRFESVLVLPEGKINCVPDLLNTKTLHQVTTHNMQCEFQRKEEPQNLWKIFPIEVAENREDAARLRRLKELAENNKDHEQALYFHAEEMRAKRWQDGRSNWTSILDLLFDKVSDYGRSVSRPSKILFFSIIAFAFVYAELAQQKNILAGLELSLTNSFGFLPFSKIGQNAALCELLTIFDPSSPITNATHCIMNSNAGITFWASLQGLISLISLFLIGLGLRNRFRLK